MSRRPTLDLLEAYIKARAAEDVQIQTLLALAIISNCPHALAEGIVQLDACNRSATDIYFLLRTKLINSLPNSTPRLSRAASFYKE